MSSQGPTQAAPDLEDELASFRREWAQETSRRRQSNQTTSTATATAETSTSGHVPISPRLKRRSLDQVEHVRQQLGTVAIHDNALRAESEAVRERPKSALDLYSEAVRSEQEGRLNDALINYRSAFRLDPDIDKTWNRANAAAQARASAASARAPAAEHHPAEFRFQRTLQLEPDYEASKQHRSAEEAHEETGGKVDTTSTHPSSTSFLLHSLLRSFAENPFERRPSTSMKSDPNSAEKGVAQQTLPATTTAIEDGVREASEPTTPEEALANLHFVPASEDKPLPLACLPREVLLLILRHLVLSPMLAPPKSQEHIDEGSSAPLRSKRGLKKLSIREEMMVLEETLDLRNVEREWKTDVEALERFARTCRAARILTLDSSIWRALGLRTYVPAQQISPDSTAGELVKSHGNDWRRFFVEHPRIRLDGCYISVVTYLRRGEVVSIYAPTHLITFYRYFRFYHHGLVISLLTTEPPNSIVRRLNPTLRMQGLTFGYWCLRGDIVEMTNLEDPGVPEASRKYAFNMACRLKSSTRGRMNKLDLISMSTQRKDTFEIESLPLRPNKPYYFSKVVQYSHD
ncbi:SCF ubiquitin ligase complex subunit HRT3 [Sporobolomyces koalae]|uniref:SCF ubiquitin ligase complex subunit HRT3 n=1 Tax=Sporobolomyces koalae TaxID=500713 RepID=UPI00317BC0BA